VISTFTKRSLAGEPPVIFGDGTQTRDFTYVRDVVQANILSLKQKVDGGEVFNVGSHQQTSLNQLAKLVCSLAGKTDLLPVYQPPRAGDIAHSYADITKISKALGYKPSYTIDSGLVQVVQWFRKSSLGNKSLHLPA
jgi:UDP-glucose 4-epimerase